MTAPPFTGDGRVTFRYIAGLLLALLGAIGGSYLSGLRADVTELQLTVRQKAEEAAALRAEMTAVHGQLTRIETKLDRLFEERPR